MVTVTTRRAVVLGAMLAPVLLACAATHAPTPGPGNALVSQPAEPSVEPEDEQLASDAGALAISDVEPGPSSGRLGPQVSDEEHCVDGMDDDTDGTIDEGCEYSFGGDLAITANWNEPVGIELGLERETVPGTWVEVEVERWDVDPCELGYTRLAGLRPKMLEPGEYRVLAAPGRPCGPASTDEFPIGVGLHFRGEPLGMFTTHVDSSGPMLVMSFRLFAPSASDR